MEREEDEHGLFLYDLSLEKRRGARVSKEVTGKPKIPENICNYQFDDTKSSTSNYVF